MSIEAVSYTHLDVYKRQQDNCVTVRERDTMKQERVNLNDLVSYIEERIKL